MEQTKREQCFNRWGQLKSERASWMAHWKDISSYLLPRSGRFFVQDRNKGDRRHNLIHDNTGTRALKVLAAGMMSGMTSPARPWFRLTTADTELAKYGPVAVWLNETTLKMRSVFSRSNTYRALHSMYGELGAFGTAASIMMPDFRNVIHHYPLTTGEFALATDERGNVVTLYREFQKTVSQIVAEYGIENCSAAIKRMHGAGQLDKWVTLIHGIEPRYDREPGKRDAKNKPWRSVTFEIGGDPDRPLRDSGFDRFPVLAPRWETVGGDVYGHSPGMESLGDIKQLNFEQLHKAKCIHLLSDPPLQVPSSLKSHDVDSLPGGITFVDAATPSGGIRTMFETRIDLSHLLADIQDVRERIRSSFYADLFMMLANQTDARMTATEVAERHEEKLLMLGPVLERLHNEMLDPMIDATFTQMMEAGIVPPPPPELQGQSLDVEFVSMLAQAQQAIGTNSVDRFVMSLGNLAQIKPEVLDKLDADKWADSYSDMLGINPELIVSSDQVALVRKQRAQAQAQQQQQEQLPQAANAVKAVSQINPQAIQDVMSMFSGYTTGG